MPQLTLLNNLLNNTLMKWAIELLPINKFTIEERVLDILNYLNDENQHYKCRVSNFDATGLLGDKLTKKSNNNIFVDIFLHEMVQIFQEPGQVFEMSLELYSDSENYEIIVLRGEIVNVLGCSLELPDSLLKDYQKLDINLFEKNN